MANADGEPIVEALRPMLVSFDLDETRIRVDWPDGTNEVEDRVQCDGHDTAQPDSDFCFWGDKNFGRTIDDADRALSGWYEA